MKAPDTILNQCLPVFAQLEGLPLKEKVETLNAIRLALSKHSPFKTEPVDCVQWIPNTQVQANDYNPNTVAPPEMKLLELSIQEDGYTQPIVSWCRDGILLVDLEAQYNLTMEHAHACTTLYKDHIELHWVCLPIALRNAVSNYQPQWLAWDPDKRVDWVRQPPGCAVTAIDSYPFFVPGMEFEEFVPEFGEWYAQGQTCACFVGIRTDESLNRFRTIALKTKETYAGKSYTTKVTDNVFNVYPIYNWGTGDLWAYHYLNPALPYNRIYEQMHKAGLSPSQMRICQPYGDDQRRGLWLYHILEPKTWYKVVARVNGVNSGALYIQETGNVTGYNKISKPDNHTWKSFCNLLLSSLPKATQDHYIVKFKVFLKWWRARGYPDGIPDEAPLTLENKRLAPSYRRLCKVLLRNDYWCRGLAFTQPKSAAYGKYLEMKKAKTLLKAPRLPGDESD